MTEKEFLALPLKQKIGQTAIVRVRDDNPEMGDCFENYFQEYGYGALFLGSEVIRPGNQGRKEIKRVAEFFRRESKIPPLICGDAENGFRNMLCDEDNFPDQMALGAAHDLSLAYRYGKANALECVECGINWTLAPVVDINKNPLNPIINLRSVSDNPHRAFSILEEVVKGMQENGLTATAKHFPGDGIDFRDQHFVKTVNSLEEEDWFEYCGTGYKRMFQVGVSAVMIGHITLPWFQKKDDFDNLPATLSYEIVTELLKNRLEFEGVAISDALEMGAYEQEYCDREKSEIESFKAGIDMLLWPSKNYFRNMENAIANGEITEERLNDALRRIYRLKKKAGCFEEEFLTPKEITTQTKQYAERVAHELAAHSVTLVRDRNGLFQRKKAIKRIALVMESPNEKGYQSLFRLKSLFENKGIQADCFRNGVDDNWQARLKKENIEKYDMLILAMYLRPHEPLGMLDYPDLELVGISKVVNLPAHKTVSVSFGSPYVHKMYCEKIPANINVYSDSIYSLQAFVNVVAGELPFNTDSPVKVF